MLFLIENIHWSCNADGSNVCQNQTDHTDTDADNGHLLLLDNTFRVSQGIRGVLIGSAIARDEDNATHISRVLTPP